MKPSSYSKEQLTVEKTNMANKLSANNRNSIGRFVEGSSGNPNGRPVGSKNLFNIQNDVNQSRWKLLLIFLNLNILMKGFHRPKIEKIRCARELLFMIPFNNTLLRNSSKKSKSSRLTNSNPDLLADSTISSSVRLNPWLDFTRILLLVSRRGSIKVFRIKPLRI